MPPTTHWVLVPGANTTDAGNMSAATKCARRGHHALPPCDVTDTALSTRRPALPGLTARVTSSKMQGFQSPFSPASRNPSHSVLLTAVRTISFCCPVRINICTGRLHGPLVKWSRRRPLTPQTGVRLSHGSPHADVVELADAASSPSGSYTVTTDFVTTSTFTLSSLRSIW